MKERVITINADVANRGLQIASYAPKSIVFHKHNFYASTSTFGSDVYSKSSVEHCTSINDLNFFDSINKCPVIFNIEPSA